MSAFGQTLEKVKEKKEDGSHGRERKEATEENPDVTHVVTWERAMLIMKTNRLWD